MVYISGVNAPFVLDSFAGTTLQLQKVCMSAYLCYVGGWLGATEWVWVERVRMGGLVGGWVDVYEGG